MQNVADAADARFSSEPATPIRRPETLEALLSLEARDLGQLYRGASVPNLQEVSGDLRGRMLAWPALSGAAGEVVRALGSWESFPWRGKSFWAESALSGRGINRVFTDRFRLFEFSTFVGRSRAGAFDAVQLDYDRPSNPFFIRAVKDEIRELSPGLYLGQAYLKTPGAETLVLYFGLSR